MVGRNARAHHSFPTLPDHLLLAYGRAQCAAYPRSRISLGVLAPICPAAAADRRREPHAQDVEEQRLEAEMRR
ncbi:hypothetical protein EDD27_4103 [Nonomuraea polychroma]|uniref:Uncharacterized protein n=1 Tax=Nonomuraea polychroma TaxID=46176 RepID=A0A438M745_9ACTN|nr:hypothetical protein [Nonomuraea polychroma]RVX41553.1 hypothetical protein EDD27_4103 [Nonomuraea polychroma]